MSVSDELFAEALKVMPGGVSSPVRAYRSVGGTPRFVKRALGSHIVDVDDKRYVDLVCSWGPMIAGHAHPEVVAAVQQAVADSTSFGAPSEVELRLAQAVVARMGGAIDKVRFTCSGTEAVMTAARLARGITKRPLLVKFVGCYHGHSDSFLVAAGSGVASLGLPDSPGVPKEVAGDTVALPYGRIDLVEELFAERGDQVAAIVTEGVPANMGVIVPPEGFNRRLHDIAHAHGALLIQDEVLTGFRLSPTGAWGLQGAKEEWTPDLFTFGKVIGGGMPLAAVGGSAQLMDYLAPEGPVYQAGTLSGNPAACAAGLATLALMDDAAYSRLDATADRVSAMADAALESAGVPHRINKVSNLFSVFLTDAPVTDFASASKQDTKAFSRFFHAALDAGLWLAPSGFEAWFCSTALDDDDLEVIDAGLHKAAQAAAQGLSSLEDVRR
ncbi:glutamate-1-semialdehyde 2,1-aminomutase [Propionibacterium freudenreichii]|uniref:Glutamate-1-semialdehyde 2,1-aminomutase n=2 Tax=Propionibacterium freudenreichii TaxID=1744 RepID=A0A509MDU9_9ACTN|nr:glutamate-1-semialdehyde 2,1-aminomutase [Propionibacterium freudenreichii]CEP27755.1 Glutamate-1-semialdehyde 2,1-aminomutase (GSA) (Glutamate-1-semialdehyde aminotransferase)(GSA-AT) [Propionibacterium freudenreichii subsp. freudenreichii]ARO11477.1 aspartate aminotransferase family protein [Propionibacterium freudenreichii]MCT2978096.1 glutamate-1-semialdehyde 2,1-aminomutase [Propionibacterium freudenreichii]MCT2987334.1 glutamate-1-semialdehyde 2,1-aminomutase [Propionibacterium freuden